MLQLLAKKKKFPELKFIKLYLRSTPIPVTQKSLLKVPILIYFILFQGRLACLSCIMHHFKKNTVLLQRGSQHYATFQVEYKVLLQRGYKFLCRILHW